MRSPTLTAIDSVSRQPGFGRRYRYDWALFQDWCAAADLASLPAVPEVLGLFLAEHPATPATQRARVSAINWHHDRAGVPAPGRSETIRRVLDANRARRLEQAKQAARQRLPDIPTTGWPQGLFGRRDSALLVLAAAGLPFERLSRLRRSEVTVVGEQLVVSGRYPLGFDLHPDPAMDPATVYRRWAEVLDFADRHPSTRLLAHHLTTGTIPAASTGPHRDGPVFTSIDRWGYTPLLPRPLAAASIATLVRQHLTGNSPAHTRPETRRPRPAEKPAVDTTAPTGEERRELGEYFDHGAAARRHAHSRLRDVGEVLGDVEARAEALLERTLAMITDWQIPAKVGE
ncbi:hypothetical protein QM787_12190 [Rhodococcus ruber]|uniref:Recombinase n=1 Tax=Rhodococcus ruber TaxID=1830 RepID=A0A098BMS7_9NOCA|nr:hypothetical protein [Rhodococcus ruber]MDI9998116.1 hypothetical protein [Rhodococcus ruber]CDZ89522.1 conserved hypothetical protein [Rhodococcus ruber]